MGGRNNTAWKCYWLSQPIKNSWTVTDWFGLHLNKLLQNFTGRKKQIKLTKKKTWIINTNKYLKRTSVHSSADEAKHIKTNSRHFSTHLADVAPSRTVKKILFITNYLVLNITGKTHIYIFFATLTQNHYQESKWRNGMCKNQHAQMIDAGHFSKKTYISSRSVHRQRPRSPSCSSQCPWLQCGY